MLSLAPDVLGRKETYLYTECGLPNVVLVGVEVRRCRSCGHHEVVLPRVTELHRTIAHAVFFAAYHAQLPVIPTITH